MYVDKAVTRTIIRAALVFTLSLHTTIIEKVTIRQLTSKTAQTVDITKVIATSVPTKFLAITIGVNEAAPLSRSTQAVVMARVSIHCSSRIW